MQNTATRVLINIFKVGCCRVVLWGDISWIKLVLQGRPNWSKFVQFILLEACFSLCEREVHSRFSIDSLLLANQLFLSSNIFQIYDGNRVQNGFHRCWGKSKQTGGHQLLWSSECIWVVLLFHVDLTPDILDWHNTKFHNGIILFLMWNSFTAVCCFVLVVKHPKPMGLY